MLHGYNRARKIATGKIATRRLPVWEDCHWEDCHCGKIATMGRFPPGKLPLSGNCLPPNLKIDEHLNLKYFGENNRKRNIFVWMNLPKFLVAK